MQNFNKTSDRQCLKLNDNKMLGKSYLNNFGSIVHFTPSFKGLRKGLLSFFFLLVKVLFVKYNANPRLDYLNNCS